MKKIVILVLILLILISSACQNKKSSVDKKQKPKGHPEDYLATDEGQSIGLSLESRNAKGDSIASSFRLNKEDGFIGHLLIQDGDQIPDNSLLTILLDYKQTPIIINKKQFLTYKLKTKQYNISSIDFKTPKLSQGMHDLTILLFAKPYNHPLNSGERVTQSPAIDYIRSNIYVVNRKNNNTLMYKKNKKFKFKKQEAFPLVLTRTANISKDMSKGMWYKKEVISGEKVNYYIHVANLNKKPFNFAIMTFLNYKQVPIDVSSKDIVMLNKLEKGKKIAIKASIIAPQKKGINELQTILIPQPYRRLATNKKVRIANINEERIQYTIRIGLVVK